MGNPYSLDLRERIVSYVEEGHSARAAAGVFGVSPSTAVRLAAAQRRDGNIAPKPQERAPHTVGELAARTSAFCMSVGRRASKTVNGTDIEYLSAGDHEIAEYDGSGTLLRRYVYGPGLDEPVATIEASSGTKSYHHQDGLGSVIALSDGATGSVADTS